MTGERTGDRRCGRCSICCRVLSVAPLDKPAGERCRFCAPTEAHPCRVYTTRPEPCREFACLWLQRPELPEALRPDRCHAVLTPTADGRGLQVTLHPHRPGAAERAPLSEFIARAVGAGRRVVVVCGDQRMARVPAGDPLARVMAAEGGGSCE